MNLLSKSLIFGSLLLIIFAYSPTIIRSDYVSQDQWRAFRYSILAQRPSFRAEGSMYMNGHYFMTGQPLVWFGECLEHAVVSKIGDFVYLRPFALLIVLVTVIYAGSVISSFVGGLVMGVVSFSLLVFVPGYSYIYFMGMSGIMQLLCILLAAASFSQFNRCLDGSKKSNKDSLEQLSKPIILFILACMIYPAWAFIVFAMALLRFGFDGSNPPAKKFEHLGYTFVFYFFASIIYYLFIKFYMVIWHLPNPDPAHQVHLQLNLGVLWERAKAIIILFYNMPILNFYSPSGGAVVILGLFSVNMGLEITKKNQEKPGAMIVWSICVFFLSAVVLIASLSPWLFSHYDSFSPRCFVPLNFFLCGSSLGLIWSMAKNLPNTVKKFIPFLSVVFLLAPSAKIQNNYSLLEMDVSRQEIQLLRSTLGKWLDKKGYINNKYLLVVRPQKERPLFVDNLLGNRELGENAVLGSAENPVEIPWMLNAVLRERSDHPMGRSIGIIDCSFDQNCVNFFLARGDVVLGITNGDKAIRSSEAPFIINFSLLTSRPIYPAIEKFQNNYGKQK